MGQIVSLLNLNRIPTQRHASLLYHIESGGWRAVSNKRILLNVRKKWFRAML